MLARSHSPRLRTRLAIAAFAAGPLIALLPAGLQSAAASSTGYTVSRVPITLAYLVAVDSATGMVYTGRLDEIQVVDSATGTVSATISMPSTADEVEGIATDPATDTVYATLRDGSTGNFSVAVISGATSAITTTISEPAGTSAYGIAVDPVTDTAYAAGSVVSVIDGATDTITGTVSASGRLAAVDAATDTIYAGGSSLSVIDGSTDTVTGSISLSGRPIGIAIDPDTDTVYVADNQSSDVDVIDAATDSVTTTISTGLPGNLDDVAVDPATDTVLASGGAFGTLFTGETWVIDGSTNAVTATLPRGGYAIATDSSTGESYAPGDDFTYGADLWEITPSAANALSPIIALGPSITFAIGRPSHVTVVSSALPAATFTESGPLPAGVTFAADGSLSGTPANGSNGSYPIMITAANGIAPDDTIDVTLVVDQPPAITSAARATFTVGKHSTFQVTATGSPAPTLSEAGIMPSGVAFSADGTLAGTPAAGTGGIYPLQFTAADSVAVVTQDFTLTVDQAPAITSDHRAVFTAGVLNRFTVVTTGFPAARLRESGQLPAGVHFVAHKNGMAKLVGVPALSTRGRRYVITIIASNGVGRPARQTFTLRIRRHRG